MLNSLHFTIHQTCPLQTLSLIQGRAVVSDKYQYCYVSLPSAPYRCLDTARSPTSKCWLLPKRHSACTTQLLWPSSGAPPQATGIPVRHLTTNYRLYTYILLDWLSILIKYDLFALSWLLLLLVTWVIWLDLLIIVLILILILLFGSTFILEILCEFDLVFAVLKVILIELFFFTLFLDLLLCDFHNFGLTGLRMAW